MKVQFIKYGLYTIFQHA